jgi:hypothetical protein
VFHAAGRIIAAGSVAALCAFGCVTPPPHPYAITPGYEGAAGASTFLLLPLNVVVALPEELQRPSGRVSQLTADYLKACGKTVSSTRLFFARDLWRGTVRDLGAAEDAERSFDAAASLFVRRLRERQQFDALVMPNLVYRTGRIVQGSRSVIWDGVKRELEIVNEPQMHGSIHLMTTPGGTMPAVSLHVLVFDGAGNRIFESYGGLDLVHEFDVAGAVTQSHFSMPLKVNRLTDEVAIREGIGVTFDPYLPPPPEPGAEGS